MLTKVLIQLMSIPEKPENPIDFIREHVGASLKEKAHIEILQQEVNAYREQVEHLTKQLEEAKRNGFEPEPFVAAVNEVDQPPQREDEEQPSANATIAEGTVTTEVTAEISPVPSEPAPTVPEAVVAKEVVPEKVEESVAVAAETVVAEAVVAPPAKVVVPLAEVVEPAKQAGTVAPADESKVEEKPEAEESKEDSVKLTDSEQKIAEVAAATAN